MQLVRIQTKILGTLREGEQHEEHDDTHQKHDGPVLLRRTA